MFWTLGIINTIDEIFTWNKTSRYAACGAALGVASCGVNDSGGGGGGARTELHFLSCIQLCWDASN